MRNLFDKEFVKEMDDFFDEMDKVIGKVETTNCDGVNFSKIGKDPDEVDVITDHLPEPKCGMDELVESLSDEDAEYWEMKAELHFEK